MRQHKIWIDVNGGTGKSFGCGQDSAITLTVNVGASASNSKKLSKIKIEQHEDGDGEISFYISIDGQDYRSEYYSKKKQEFKGISGRQIDGSIEAAKKREEESTASILKMAANVAAMGEFFTDNKAEANDWKARMLKAGVPAGAISMPDDWDQLSEEEKERRLNGAIEILQKS